MLLSAAVGAALPSLKLPLLKAEIQLTAIVNYLLLPIYILASFAPLLSGPSSVWSSHFALSIALARFIGKPLGISLFVLIASQLPKIFGERTISIGEAVVGGALAGMGLAVSLVITTFTFGSTYLAVAAKAGLVIAIPLSFLLATLAHALHSRSGE